MARVTGIGGVFFKARDDERVARLVSHTLGLDIEPWGGVAFNWRDGEASGRDGTTGLDAFSPPRPIIRTGTTSRS